MAWMGMFPVHFLRGRLPELTPEFHASGGVLLTCKRCRGLMDAVRPASCVGLRFIRLHCLKYQQRHSTWAQGQ